MVTVTELFIVYFTLAFASAVKQNVRNTFIESLVRFDGIGENLIISLYNFLPYNNFIRGSS